MIEEWWCGLGDNTVWVLHPTFARRGWEEAAVSFPILERTEFLRNRNTDRPSPLNRATCFDGASYCQLLNNTSLHAVSRSSPSVWRKRGASPPGSPPGHLTSNLQYLYLNNQEIKNNSLAGSTVPSSFSLRLLLWRPGQNEQRNQCSLPPPKNSHQYRAVTGGRA